MNKDMEITTILFDGIENAQNVEGLWNATALVSKYNKNNNTNKRVNNWLRTDECKTLISLTQLINEDQIVKTVATDPMFGGGTWIHEDLVLYLACWLNPVTYLWCTDNIKNNKERYSCVEANLQDLFGNRTLEAEVQQFVEAFFSGINGRYLQLSCGIPDVITDEFLIEIKDAKHYKYCLGQLLAYGSELEQKSLLNGRQSMAYLFNSNNVDKKYIESLLQQYGIIVRYHEDYSTINLNEDINEYDWWKYTSPEQFKYRVTNPDGTKHYVKSLYNFCKHLEDVDYSYILKLLKQSEKVLYKDYVFEINHKQDQDDLNNIRKYKRMTQDMVYAECIETGVCESITFISEWAHNRGIKSWSNIYAVLNKTRKTAYGYRFWYMGDEPAYVRAATIS